MFGITEKRGSLWIGEVPLGASSQTVLVADGTVPRLAVRPVTRFADWWSAGDSVTARGPTPFWRTAKCAGCVPTPSGESTEFKASSLSGVASGRHQQLPFDNPLFEVEFK